MIAKNVFKVLKAILWKNIHSSKLPLQLLMCLTGINKVLVGDKFGALEKDLPEEMVNFVKAVEDMMYTGHQLMVFCNLHKKFNSKIWRTHVQSWDTILEVSKCAQ